MAETGAGMELFRYRGVEKCVLEMIESGALRPGDRAPSLRSLSSRLKVSVATVSQAYVELERRGVVEARPRSGFFVRPQARRSATAPSKAAPATTSNTVNRGALIRMVLDTVGREDILPFGVATTAEELLPVKQLARVLGGVVRSAQRRAVNYGTVIGDPELRRQIAFRAIDSGARFEPEGALVTSGALEALYIAVRAVTRPGDTVAIASPSYYCFLQLLENLGLRSIEIPSCPECGVDPAELETTLDRFDVKACILSLNFNNPDGSLTPEDAKRRIVSALAKRRIPCIEDDVYGDLYFGAARPRTLKSYDEEGLVLHCSSFSKTLAPGFRVGWLAPGAFFEKAFEIKATTNVSTAMPTQLAVAEYLRIGQYDRHLRRLRGALHEQMELMRACVVEHFPPETKITKPTGGSALWLELPGLDSIRFFYEAKALGVGVAPGVVFSARDKYNSFVRLSYGSLWTTASEEGVRLLGALAARQLAGARD
jgi:DNA-binding transcriptional MocR family regulator